MERTRAILIAVLLLAISTTTVSAYTGTLTTSTGLGGSGLWVTNTDPGKYTDWFPAYLTWEVVQLQDGWWSYSYEMKVYKGGVSHFIIELSPTFTCNNIRNASGDFGNVEYDDFVTGPGNPGMPGTIHGIKFDNAYGETFNVSFESNRAPMWGDFYAKDGTVGGGGLNAAWNLGLTNPDTDPIAPISDGSVGFHILVPDTVPEPSGMIALTAGIMGMAGLVLRKRR